MGREHVADTLTQVRVAGLRRRGEEPSPEETERIRSEVSAHFRETSHPYYLTSDLRDDGLIHPVETRNTLGMALSAVLNAPIVRSAGRDPAHSLASQGESDGRRGQLRDGRGGRVAHDRPAGGAERAFRGPSGTGLVGGLRRFCPATTRRPS